MSYQRHTRTIMGCAPHFAKLLMSAQTVFCTFVSLSCVAVAFFISKRLNDSFLDYLGPLTTEEICSVWGYWRRSYAFCTFYNFVAGELINDTSVDSDSSSPVSILIGCLLGIYSVKTVLAFILLNKMHKIKQGSGSGVELIVWMITTIIGFVGEILCVWWLQFHYEFEKFGTYSLGIVLAVIGGCTVVFDCFYIVTMKWSKGKINKYHSFP